MRRLRYHGVLILVIFISKYCRSCFSFKVQLNVSSPCRELRCVAGWVWGSRLGEARHQAAEDQEETPRPLLPGSGVWAGTALQAAALPVRPRERALGKLTETYLHPGQDLVPEQEVQMQEAAAGQDSGDGRPLNSKLNSFIKHFLKMLLVNDTSIIWNLIIFFQKMLILLY